MDSISQNLKYRREIDGLRAIAVLAVLFHHSNFSIFQGGYVGVDIFFVISGYLITDKIVRDLNDGTFSLLEFYERRARRILPALFALLTLCLPFAWYWLLLQDLEQFSQSLISVSVFASNFFFWQTLNYFERQTELLPLIHTWSLAVEEQFYILFPILLIFVWKFCKKYITQIFLGLFIVSLGLAQFESASMSLGNFYLLPTRGWELLVGSFAFLFHSNKLTKSREMNETACVFGLLLVFTSIFLFDKNTPFPSFYTLMPTVGTALIIVFSKDTFVCQLLSIRPVCWVGLISYSLYLWHQPVLAFTKYRFFPEINILVLYILMFSLATLSWKFVERPMRDKSKCSTKYIFWFSVLGTLSFFSIGIIGSQLSKINENYQLELTKLPDIAQEHANLRRDDICNADKKNTLLNCVLGHKETAPDYAIIGDSNAASLVHELNESFKKERLSFVQYTKNGCFDYSSVPRACVHFIEKAVLDIKNRNIKVIIFHSRWSEKNANETHAVFEAYADGIRSLSDIGREVLVIYPTPVIDLERRFERLLMLNEKNKPSMLTVEHNKALDKQFLYNKLDKLADQKQYDVIYPEKIFCDTFVKGECVVALNGEMLYYDQNHLSNAGAALIVEEIVKRLILRN